MRTGSPSPRAKWQDRQLKAFFHLEPSSDIIIFIHSFVTSFQSSTLDVMGGEEKCIQDFGGET